MLLLDDFLLHFLDSSGSLVLFCLIFLVILFVAVANLKRFFSTGLSGTLALFFEFLFFGFT